MGRARGIVVVGVAAIALVVAVRASGQIVTDDGGTTPLPVDDGGPAIVDATEPVPPVVVDAGTDSPVSIDAPSPGPTTPTPDASTPLPLPDAGAGCESCDVGARRPCDSGAIAAAVVFALATLRRRR